MVYSASGATILSPDEFMVHPAAKGRTELVRGRIRMMPPANMVHGLVSATVLRLLSTYVWQHRLGQCFADSTGYTLPNLLNTVRAPDASFVRASRLPADGVAGGYHQLAPDLAVEVLSPSESKAELSEKLADYFAAGTPVVWVIDPATRTVAVVSANGSTTPGVTDSLTGGDVVPGFSCGVAELFEGLAPIERR
ncbi:MAG: Uma2 family endonuclease [bacterium]